MSRLDTALDNIIGALTYGPPPWKEQQAWKFRHLQDLLHDLLCPNCINDDNDHGSEDSPPESPPDFGAMTSAELHALATDNPGLYGEASAKRADADRAAKSGVPTWAREMLS